MRNGLFVDLFSAKSTVGIKDVGERTQVTGLDA